MSVTSVNEKEFSQFWANQQQKYLNAVVILAAYPFNIIGLLSAHFTRSTYPDPAEPQAYFFFHLMGILLATWCVFVHKKGWSDWVGIYSSNCLVLVLLFIVKEKITFIGSENLLFPNADLFWFGLINLSNLVTTGIGPRSKSLFLQAIIYIGTTVFFSLRLPEDLPSGHAPMNLMYVHICTIVVGALIRYGLDSFQKRAGCLEYRYRKRMVPANFIRNSMTSSVDIDEAFAPRIHECVIISSDWRSFQKLTSEVSEEKLNIGINEYYDHCEERLEHHFPEGNYYFDWIADELFIVIFEDSHCPRSIAQSAIELSLDLINNLKVFEEKHGFPKGADVGISAGPARVGLMGPKGFPKATALGEVAGRARRIETVGKLLRDTVHPCNRVVFDQGLKDKLPQCLEYKSIEIEEGEVKDLPKAICYYLEENVESDKDLKLKAG